MKKLSSNLILVLLLIFISLILYLIQISLFKTPGNTAFYFLQDLAFLPVQVAFVSLVLNRIISMREKKERLKKMNMAINAFFGEAGTEMIKLLKNYTAIDSAFQIGFGMDGRWTARDFQKAAKTVKGYDFGINSRNGDLVALKGFLTAKRTFLLLMLENSSLMEHDTFSDMLWTVFHLTDELVARESFIDLPKADLDHLSIDMGRTYSSLIAEWINYCAHLKIDYPYLFSMAIRTNPFDENRSIIFK